MAGGVYGLYRWKQGESGAYPARGGNGQCACMCWGRRVGIGDFSRILKENSQQLEILKHANRRIESFYNLRSNARVVLLAAYLCSSFVRCDPAVQLLAKRVRKTGHLVKSKGDLTRIFCDP